MSSFNVTVFDNTSGNSRTVTVEYGATVANAAAGAGVSTEGAQVRVNNRPADVGDKVGSGDLISITKIGLKGAIASFQELLQAINGEDVGQKLSGVAALAQQAQQEEAKTVLVETLKGLLNDAAQLVRRTELDIVQLGKTLEKAEKHHAKVEYCVDQLKGNNPFPFLALMSRKADARDLCNALGVLCPENDDVVWNTAPAAE